MKLIVKYISITYILVILFTTLFFYVNAESNVEVIDELVDETELDYIYEYNDLIIKEKDDYIYINNSYESITYGNIIKCSSIDMYTFVLYFDEINYNIICFYEDKLIHTFIIETFDVVNDIALYDESIYLVGSINKNLQVSEFSFDGDILNVTDYSGDGYQEGTNIIIKDDYIYVGVVKSAHTLNDKFLNVGNLNDVKSALFKYDLNLKELDYIYFNEGDKSERITSFVNYGSNISVMLQCDEVVVYEMNKDLDLLTKEISKEKHIIELETLKKFDNSHIYVLNKLKKIKLYYYNENSQILIHEINGDYINHLYNKGSLYIYYIYGNKTYKRKISEYHINYSHDLVCDYYTNNELTQNHFDVDSYFEDLNFKLENISPYFIRTMSGEYIATYKAEKLDGSILDHSTKIIVKPYVNIINNGIYSTGSRLYFFGNGVLDGATITSGYQLNNEGKHQLSITNIQGEKEEFTIYVVDNYYNTNMDINMETTYTINHGDKLFLELKSSKIIKEVVFSNNEIGKIRIINNKQYIEISDTLTPGIYIYDISKVIFDDNSEINLNQCFSVKVNKRSISYDITEYMKDGKLNLAISINDLDQNVNDVLLRVTSNDKEIYNKSTCVKNYNDLININNQNKVTLDLVIQTKDGNEFILFSYVGRGDELNYKIKYEIKDEIIEQINFELDLSDVSLKHERIYVGGTEVKSLPKKYQMENNNIIWYIAGISSIVLGISFVVYIFVKRMLRRRKGL